MPYLDKYAFDHFWLFCDSHFWLCVKDAISGIFLLRANKERKRMENKKSNTNSRDIKRRIDVVMKKLDALRELGVPCAVCYVSHWTKGLMVYGDSRMTNVISNQAATMLQELENSEEPEPHDRGLFLPPIPAPLKDLNFRTMQSMIIALAKDLKVDWSEDRPSWWPQNVPFCHPRHTPSQYTGTE